LEPAINIQGNKEALVRGYKHILGSRRLGVPFGYGTVEFCVCGYAMEGI